MPDLLAKLNLPGQNGVNVSGALDSLINGAPGANPYLVGQIQKGINQSSNAFGNMLGTSLAMAPAFVVSQKARIADLDGPVALRSDRIGAMTYDHGVVAPFTSELWG